MKLRILLFLWVLCSSAVNVFSLDREAFTFTNYDLDVRVEPDQQRLGVRGKISLRNDSSTPQKIAALQISSSLDWRSIKAGDQQLQFISQSYTSDIDHTGVLTEAIVTLPSAIPPKGTIDLDIAYEGVIVLDATRLTRLGAPESTASTTDWDQISSTFTAVRGVGYVAWYPIATEAASLSEENNLSEVLGRWKARQADSAMAVVLRTSADLTILFSGTPSGSDYRSDEKIGEIGAFKMTRFGMSAPTFVLANYRKADVKGGSTVFYLPNHEAAAKSYVEILGGIDPIPTSNGSRRLQVADVPDSDVSEFVSESLLLLPLKPSVTEADRLALVYAVARGELILTRRPWISDGLAHCEQALDIEQRRGREAALSYLEAHRPVLVAAEKSFAGENAGGEGDRRNSLIQSNDEVYVASKSMWVWWMLRDMLPGKNLTSLMHAYNPAQDKEPSYLQRLIEKETKKDLEWFFDDWVYRDRGLPDFKIESVFPRKTLPEGYMVTVTISNQGVAGAEVPITIKFDGGEVVQRLVVHGKSSGVIRIPVTKAPEEVVVNDGSVPESDMTNNTFKVVLDDSAK
jgi:hypothetical protein